MSDLELLIATLHEFADGMQELNAAFEESLEAA